MENWLTGIKQASSSVFQVWKMIEELYRLQLFELEIKYLKGTEMKCNVMKKKLIKEVKVQVCNGMTWLVFDWMFLNEIVWMKCDN